MKKSLVLLPLLILAACGPKDGIHTLQLLTTNDVHGYWFDSTYAGNSTRQSIFAVNYYVDSVRNACGEQNVLLVDAGDCLQVDTATYYYNYVDTEAEEHLFTKIVSYMKYDAITMGNHDVETGHPVYDKLVKQLGRHKIPFLGGNAIRNDNGKPYFQVYKTYKRAGLKVMVLGYTNANNPAWMDETLWKGMHFERLVPLVQKDVDKYAAREKPDVVIVSIHSATGKGEFDNPEAEGLDLYKTLRGVDFVVCSHDHREVTFFNDSIALINTGNRAKYLGHGTLQVEVKDGKVVDRKVCSELIKVDKTKADPAMRELFHPEYESVKAFSFKEIGMLQMDLRTRDAYLGMCDYMNLLHTVELESSGAQIAFAAPLTFNGSVKAGTLVYNDLFLIYPFENQLFTMKLTGKEIKNYLEYSYDTWLDAPESGHGLRIVKSDDPRNNQRGWSFVNRAYNFDSASGINYTVDITKPAGERISISSLADGTPFNPEEEYAVALSSYRASGAGHLLTDGAGIPKEELEGRILGKMQEIRDFVYEFIEKHGLVDPELIGDRNVIGSWKFVPEDLAAAKLGADYQLLF